MPTDYELTVPNPPQYWDENWEDLINHCIDHGFTSMALGHESDPTKLVSVKDVEGFLKQASIKVLKPKSTLFNFVQ